MWPPGDRLAVNFVDGGRQAPDPSPDADELWRVFVLLRHCPGVYERAIRAAGPLEAERAVAIADRDVLETLGSQFLGRRLAAGGAEADSRRVEPVGRRFLVAPHRGQGAAGATAVASAPTVEVLTPRPGPKKSTP